MCSADVLLNVKPWKMLTSIVNSAVSVFTSSGKNPYAILSSISSCLDHSLIKFMSFLTALVDTAHCFILEGFATKMGNRVDTGR